VHFLYEVSLAAPLRVANSGRVGWLGDEYVRTAFIYPGGTEMPIGCHIIVALNNRAIEKKEFSLKTRWKQMVVLHLSNYFILKFYRINNRLLTDSDLKQGRSEHVTRVVTFNAQLVVNVVYFVQVDRFDFFHAGFYILGFKEILHRVLVYSYLSIIFLKFVKNKYKEESFIINWGNDRVETESRLN
jgi:hypothetical protein